MTGLIAHRGPDDARLLLGNGFAFGHRRLSIIDVAGSPQPMSSPDGRLHVCFNGEILNYRQLRREIAYDYQTSGDTEVLLAAFDRLGARSVDRLRGQFAYALYSEKSRELWLFRDRLGILPLYYYADDDMFAFASEIKALLPALPRQPAVDLASVADYMTRRSVPAPWTLFEGVRKVPPGATLCVKPDGRVTVTPYWAPDSDPARFEPSSAEAVDQLEELLRRAVESNLVADVPVGAYLSGGLDSSLIVALMRSVRPEADIQTFSAAFGDPRFDETVHARRVAASHRTTHREVRVAPSEFEELWAPLTWHRDAPISEASDIAVFRLASLAAQSVKVVLSGEGADELFAGYPKHRFAGLTDRSSVVPPLVRRGLGRLEHALPEPMARPRIALRALGGSTELDRMEGWFAPFTVRERQLLLPNHAHHMRPAPAGHEPLRRMLVADVRGWLTDNLLERGDRMSMAASLELRPPYLDHTLVEWALRLPAGMKIRNGQGKWVLRQAASRYLPPDIVSRRKVGFRVPLDAWFKGELRPLVHEALVARDSFVGTIMDRTAIRDLLRRHMTSRSDESLRIWTLASLEMWHRVFFKGQTQGAAFQTVRPERVDMRA